LHQTSTAAFSKFGNSKQRLDGNPNYKSNTYLAGRYEKMNEDSIEFMGNKIATGRKTNANVGDVSIR